MPFRKRSSFLIAILLIFGAAIFFQQFLPRKETKGLAAQSIFPQNENLIFDIFSQSRKKLLSILPGQSSGLAEANDLEASNPEGGLDLENDQDDLLPRDSVRKKFSTSGKNKLQRKTIKRNAGKNALGNSADREGNDLPTTTRAQILYRLPSAVVGEDYCQHLDPQWSTPPYQWQFVAGSLPEGIIFDGQNGMVCGKVQQEGFYQFQVSIFDRKESIIINYELLVLTDSAPERAGDLAIITSELPDGFVGQEYFLQLTGRAGAYPLIWSSTLLPDGLSLDAQSGILYGVPTQSGLQSLEIFLKDHLQKTVSKKFTLNIKTSPLFITTQQLKEAIVGQTYFQKMTAQGGAPPYVWRIVAGIIPEGLFFDSQTASFQGTPLQKEINLLSIQVTDQKGKSDTVQLPLGVGSSALAIVTTQLPQGDVGQLYYNVLSAQGGEPPYYWSLVAGHLPSGIEFQPSGIVTGTPLEGRGASLKVKVEDQARNSITANLELRINDHPLEILSENLPAASVGAVYSFRLDAQGGVPAYLWDVTQGQFPVGILLSPRGLLSGEAFVKTNAHVTIRLRDDTGYSVEKEFLLAVDDESLFILTKNIDTATIHSPYEFQFQAQEGTPPYLWKISGGNLPAGLNLHASGSVSGTPAQTGLFPFDLEVTDSQGEVAIESLSLSVIAEPLMVMTPALADGTTGSSYQQQLEASGGISPYVWSISSGGLPLGVSLNANTGMITGSASQAGLFDVTFEVTDLLDKTASGDFQFKITGQPLAIVTDALDQGSVNESYEELLTAQGGVPPYSWEIVDNALPAGLTLTQTGSVSGIPTTAGVKDFMVQVKDQEQVTQTKRLLLTIENQPLTFVTDQLPDGKMGVSYLFALEVTGGRLPYQWRVAAGALPSGLSLNLQDGVISGTPQQAEEQTNFQISVSDQQRNIVAQDFSLRISSADLTPVSAVIARGSDTKVGLAWTNPASPQFHHVDVVRSSSGVPQMPGEGLVIYSGRRNNIVNQNCSNGTTYFYSVFAYDPSGGHAPLAADSSAQATPQEISLNGPKNPFVDEVVLFSPLDAGNYFGSTANVIGAPRGSGEWAGSLNVLSLHAKLNNDQGATPPYGGSIILRFTDNIVVNGQGVDFIIFENAFRMFGTDSYWIEPAVVDVSLDGINYYRFPFDFVPHYNNGQLNLQNPFSYARGFAGVRAVFSNNSSPDPTNPNVAGGDPFDLADLGVDLSWIQYIKITSTGDGWLQDLNGDYVRHSNEAPTWSASGRGNSGFDLDAVGAVHY